jgi:2-C-methyl-D-erythritol 4-phosphate cytidylyltransferase
LSHDAVKDSEVVLVHDAVRPFASKELIQKIMLNAIEYGAAIPGLTPKDTIKQVTSENIIDKTIDRNKLRMVQTPQGFRYSIIKAAFDNALSQKFEGTDSASLVELLGKPVKVIDGEETNIKITTPLDKILAEHIIHSK